MRLAQACDDLPVVIAEFGEHILRRDEIRVADARSKFRERPAREALSHLGWLFSGFATYQSLLNLHRSKKNSSRVDGISNR
jgi:hypothetical protein